MTDRGWIFFAVGDNVYRTRESSPVDVNGQPMGARWFCPTWQWQWLQQNGVYPFEQQRLAA